jgi:hypothetical protein
MNENGLTFDADEGSRSVWPFWLALAGGWLAYLLINLSVVAVYEEAAADKVVWIAIVNVLPPALVSIVVARYRRRLLRPEWSLGRTLGVHLVVGIAFALATSGLAFLLMESGGAIGPLAEASALMRFTGVMVNGLFR